MPLKSSTRAIFTATKSFLQKENKRRIQNHKKCLYLYWIDYASSGFLFWIGLNYMKQKNNKVSSTQLITAILGLSTVSIAHANTPSPSPFFKSGFYLGAQAGYAQMQGNIKGTLHQAIPGSNLPPSDSQSTNAKKSRPIGEFLAGYRHLFTSGFMIGGELAVGYSGHKITSQTFNHFNRKVFFKTSVERTYFATPSIVIGKVFSRQWLGFLKLGLGISKFKSLTQNVDEHFDFRGKKTQIGFVPALGLEYAATPRVSLLGSISYEIYGKVQKKFNQVLDADIAGTHQYAFSTKPKFITLKIGLIIKV